MSACRRTSALTTCPRSFGPPLSIPATPRSIASSTSSSLTSPSSRVARPKVASGRRSSGSANCRATSASRISRRTVRPPKLEIRQARRPRATASLYRATARRCSRLHRRRHAALAPRSKRCFFFARCYPSFLPLRSCLQTAPAARAEQRFAAEIARDSLTGGTLSFELLRRRRAAFALRVVWASIRSGRNRDRRSG